MRPLPTAARRLRNAELRLEHDLAQRGWSVAEIDYTLACFREASAVGADGMAKILSLYSRVCKAHNEDFAAMLLEWAALELLTEKKP